MDKDSDEYLKVAVEEDSDDEAEMGSVRMSQIERMLTLMCGLLYCHENIGKRNL